MTYETKKCEDFFPSMEEIQNHVDITPIEEVNHPRLKSWACESMPTEEVVVAIDIFH